jgi:hypothetical protein
MPDSTPLDELPESKILWRVVRYLESVRADAAFVRPVKHAARLFTRLEQRAAEKAEKAP